MKKIGLLLAFVPIFCFGQKNVILPMDSATQKVNYKAVVEIENKDKAVLFSAAQKWMIGYNTSNNLIIMQTYEDQIIAKGSFKANCVDNDLFSSCEGCRSYNLVFSLTISVKDNKFKYDFNNLTLQYKKGASAVGMYSYGLAVADVKESEIVSRNLEDFYPIRKKQCKNPWNDVFAGIDNNINKIIDSLIIAMKKNGGDW